MENLSNYVYTAITRPPDKPKQGFLRNWYANHYHAERFFVIESIEKEELEVLQNEEIGLKRWLLPYEMKSIINKIRLDTSRPEFNWPGFNQIKQIDYGIGNQAIESLKNKIRYYIDRCNFNEDKCDEYNWHIIDNVLFENKHLINYRTLSQDEGKASKNLF